MTLSSLLSVSGAVALETLHGFSKRLDSITETCQLLA